MMTIEQMLADLAHYATAERTTMYAILWRNAGVGVEWYEEDRCTTEPYEGSDLGLDARTNMARMNEGLVVYGYHDDIRTALACELIRFLVRVTDGDDEEMRRRTIRDHCMADAGKWFGRDPLPCLLDRTCIACAEGVVTSDQHSEPRELNYAMTALCDRCQSCVGL